MTYLTSGSSGISILSLLFLFLFTVDDTAGQVAFNHDLSSQTFVSKNQSSSSIPDNLKIIGVMVEFIPDTNRFTSGNGTFEPGSIPYLENPGTNIDALPHNESYFEAHLEFSRNYFETVSNENISVDFDVLPQVYRLSQPMAYYSPTGVNPDLSVMAQFVADVWTLIGDSGSLPISLNQSENTAFVIFHAGVGRDIELTGTNLDKTPQDLPSIYLSKKTLSDFFDDPSFSGFPIDNGNMLVDHSMIVPRTLTRAGEDATGNRFLLPLSINGLLTAQIGSYLGLPDLFDTNTGLSGIGRFGLMDGAGIFAYNGIFPPELSAWEKMYLGWASPFSVDYDADEPISLPSASNHETYSIAKIPISGDEYFLVENRHRDPVGEGITLTIKKEDGSYVEQQFTNHDEDFVRQAAGFDDLLEAGVVVGVSNYDFALPGGLIANSESENNTETLNGGILVWHIDNSIIREKIGRNNVNNNPDRRGIDVEEADGAQDIGQPTPIGLFQNEVNGSPFDFWWSGNSVRTITQSDTIQFYDNRFGPDTMPDNDSNSGAPSYFELYDFSDNLPTASFRIRLVNPFSDLYELSDSKSDLQIKTASEPNNPYWKRYPLGSQQIVVENEHWIILPGYDGIQFYHPENKTITEPLLSIPSLQQPFIHDELITVTENPNDQVNQLTLTIYHFDGENLNKSSDFSVQSNRSFISSFENNILDVDGTTDRIDLISNEIIETEKPIQFSDKAGDYQSRIENGTIILNFPGGSESFLIHSQDEKERQYTGIIQDQENQFLFYLLGDGQISVFKPNDGYQSKHIIHNSDFIDWPAFADFNGNGSPDILFVDYSSNQLIGKNINGASLSSFPIIPPKNVKFIGTPLVADLDGDDTIECIITGYDDYSMNLYAYDKDGKPVEGFPLYVGGIENNESQPIHPLISGDKLIAVSHLGDLKVWEFKKLKDLQWRSRYGNQTSNKVSGFIEFDEPSNPQFSLLNSDETYNWPNPAKDETLLRYQTSDPAEIHIKILTMSGRVIGNHICLSQGGVAEELRIDTSTWASGGYFALVEAKANGKTERKLVKIAIAR